MSARTASRLAPAETVTSGASKVELVGEARLEGPGALAAKAVGTVRILGAETIIAAAISARESAAARRTWCCGFECICGAGHPRCVDRVYLPPSLARQSRVL